MVLINSTSGIKEKYSNLSVRAPLLKDDFCLRQVDDPKKLTARRNRATYYENPQHGARLERSENFWRHSYIIIYGS